MICRLFHVLAQFLFTKSETELVFITRKWVYELLHELSNELRLRILGNEEIERKFLKCLDFMENTHPTTQNPNFRGFDKISQKSSCKTFQRKIRFCLVLSICLQPFVQDCTLTFVSAFLYFNWISFQCVYQFVWLFVVVTFLRLPTHFSFPVSFCWTFSLNKNASSRFYQKKVDVKDV